MVLENEPSRGRVDRSLDGNELGYDELNLAEFALASVSERFLDGSKTVLFEDTVWDREKAQWLPRKLAVSGSDRYGLPTAKDDDVLLACIQMSSYGDFSAREVFFSRYELLKLLRWKDETRNYRRLAVSLRRWLGLSVYSDRAFFDKDRQSWVNRDFGIFDSLDLYEREIDDGSRAPASSRFVWNEVLFSSFQAGYLKRLDWDLYCRLTSPVAKRLYRFLDKRFYFGHRVEIDLRELTTRKVRLAQNYKDVAQIKRQLLKGIEELEAQWELKRLDSSKRFIRKAGGKWTVVFERRRRRTTKLINVLPVDSATIETQLTKRGLGPAMAAELVAGQDPDQIQRMTELYDWYNARGQERGPGFLVQAIRNPEQVTAPPGFESSADVETRRRSANRREQSARASRQKREQEEAAAETKRWESFQIFWRALEKCEQELFEKEALKRAERLKRQGYCRAMGVDEQVFEQYRQVILRDHFERSGMALGA